MKIEKRWTNIREKERGGEKKMETQLHKEWNRAWHRLSKRGPGSNTPQDTNCTATCPLSRKLFKLDEPDMQDTAGEAEMNS